MVLTFGLKQHHGLSKCQSVNHQTNTKLTFCFPNNNYPSTKTPVKCQTATSNSLPAITQACAGIFLHNLHTTAHTPWVSRVHHLEAYRWSCSAKISLLPITSGKLVPLPEHKTVQTVNCVRLVPTNFDWPRTESIQTDAVWKSVSLLKYSTVPDGRNDQITLEPVQNPSCLSHLLWQLVLRQKKSSVEPDLIKPGGTWWNHARLGEDWWDLGKQYDLGKRGGTRWNLVGSGEMMGPGETHWNWRNLVRLEDSWWDWGNLLGPGETWWNLVKPGKTWEKPGQVEFDETWWWQTWDTTWSGGMWWNLLGTGKNSWNMVVVWPGKTR